MVNEWFTSGDNYGKMWGFPSSWHKIVESMRYNGANNEKIGVNTNGNMNWINLNLNMKWFNNHIFNNNENKKWV